MMIGPHPITVPAAMHAVEEYVNKMRDFSRECPEIVPRWMRLRTRPAFVLRHSGRFLGTWRIVRCGSCDASSRTFERISEGLKRGGVAIVFLEYEETTTAVRIDEKGKSECSREQQNYQRELVGFKIGV